MTQRDTRPRQVSRKSRRMYDLYKHFAKDWAHCLDFSNESMLELYLSESYGDVECKHTNGYLWGKRWLSVNVAMWKEDIDKGVLFKHELYSDPNFPHWWLDNIFGNNYSESFKQ